MYQPSRRVRIEERSADSGTRQLEEGARLPRSCREADMRRGAALTQAIAAAGVSRLPLDGVVVELDVEVAGDRGRNGRSARPGRC